MNQSPRQVLHHRYHSLYKEDVGDQHIIIFRSDESRKTNRKKERN